MQGETPYKISCEVTKKIYYVSLFEVARHSLAAIKMPSHIRFGWPANNPIASSPAARIYDDHRKAWPHNAESTSLPPPFFLKVDNFTSNNRRSPCCIPAIS